MARRLIWSPHALDQIEDIAAYLDRNAGTYARIVVTRIFERMETVTDFPGQGRRVPELPAETGYREVFAHRWRLIYRADEDAVTVIAVVHGARDLDEGKL